MADVDWGNEPEQPYKPKPKKKHQRKVEHLQQTPTVYTPPMRIGSVIDALMPPKTDESALALEIIDNGPHLALTLSQWRAVQALVEQGIRCGDAGYYQP